ncbi:hypothetical protein DPMN_091701 [Dreissena polymorpha]|uniref:Uncharacterized protein n=1 Tax=Dreissena polymorpha TaxID=45954 RepID=A0A9D4R081_DREPO|nr:hypothetical protein DPMN_091701 [Dreissena polymorpha]
MLNPTCRLNKRAKMALVRSPEKSRTRAERASVALGGAGRGGGAFFCFGGRAVRGDSDRPLLLLGEGANGSLPNRCDPGQVPHLAGPDIHGSQPGFVGVTLAKLLTKLVLIYMALNQDSIRGCDPGQVPHLAGPDILGSQPGFVGVTLAKFLT